MLARLRQVFGGSTIVQRVMRRSRRAGSTRLLLRRPGFDEEWYALVSGRTLTRREAVRDYLRRGAREGLSPAPLFDPQTFLSHGGILRPGRDAFTSYLSLAANFSVPTHPLFDVARYIAATPESLGHPGGPLEHYRTIGAAAGLPANDWFEGGAHPEGLVTWLREKTQSWTARHQLVAVERRSDSYDQQAERRLLESYAGVQPARSDDHPVLVSVVMPVWNRAAEAAVAIDSVRAQTLTDWELLIVDDGSTDDLAATMARYAGDDRIRLVSLSHGGVGRARNAGIRESRGQYVAWLDSDDTFTSEHLRVLLAFMQAEGLRAAYDILELRAPGEPAQYRTLDGGREYLELANHIGQTVIVCERSLLDEVGTYDETLPRAVDYDLILRIAARTPLRMAPFVGCVVNQNPTDAGRISVRLPDTWTDVVINRNIIDWAQLDADTSPPRRRGSVSVIIPTPNEFEMTSTSVESVVAAARDSELDVDILVVDNGTAMIESQVLASLAERYANVSVVTSPINRGYALGNNLALPHAAGATVVFLNNDTRVGPGWLDPLVAALDDPEVLGAQSLLVYESGAIQSAGVVFPSRGGVPHVLLQGFPVEDALDMAEQGLNALTGAALAVRFADVVALRGFDPIFRNGLEDVDICLRLAGGRTGAFRVVPTSRVEHFESRSPGRSLRILDNREIFRDRWGTHPVQDDVQQWRERGFDIVGYEVRHVDGARSDLSIPSPVLSQVRPRLAIGEGIPSLRWAIKNPAPPHAAGRLWGDTSFAEGIAAALRDRGQRVSIDANPEFGRRTGRHDDVVLVLRGLSRYQPLPGQLNLLWVISHPELIGAEEARQYDRVFAASRSWARDRSHAWRVPILPLLQATDPKRFRPEAGTPDTGAEVLFVGNSRRMLRPIVRDALAAELPLTLYGADWLGLVPSDVIAGTHIPNEQLASFYRSARVLLNDHWENMRTNGFLSNRLFDAVASGARVISDDVQGQTEVFGPSVQIARNPDDLRRLVSSDLDTIFGDDTTRLAAAASVAREHSFGARADTLVAEALELSAAWPETVTG